MKTYKVIYKNGLPYLREINPYEYDPAPEFASTMWSRFESNAEREALPLLSPLDNKEQYKRDEFDIIEAYFKDGYITYDPDRPFYARNMGLKIIDAAVPLARIS